MPAVHTRRVVITRSSRASSYEIYAVRPTSHINFNESKLAAATALSAAFIRRPCSIVVVPLVVSPYSFPSDRGNLNW